MQYAFKFGGDDDDGFDYNGMLIVFCEWILLGRGPCPTHRDDFTIAKDLVQPYKLSV